MIKDLIQAILEGKDYTELFDKEFNTFISAKLNELRNSVYGKLLETSKCHEEGSEKLVPETINGKVTLRKVKIKVTEDVEIDVDPELDVYDYSLDEGIVVGSGSKVYHRETAKGERTVYVTDSTGKEHPRFKIKQKDGTPEELEKAANSMSKAVADRYGVKTWNKSK